MAKVHEPEVQSPMRLVAETAADLMSPNPVSIRDNASVQEALACLTDRSISAAPVIDDAGRAIGVISRSDLLIHERERSEIPATLEDDDEALRQAFRNNVKMPTGFHEHVVDRTQVLDIMTPAVFCVNPETSARDVVRQMLGFKVHRLFVVDEHGILVGTISSHDILCNLE
jgi:CBS-domain-containing membrane protein